MREGRNECLMAEKAQLKGQGCSLCGHLTLQLAASERRAGALAKSLEDLKEQLTMDCP